MIVVGVEYPWLPMKCSHCHAFGYVVHACSKVERKAWIPKKPVNCVVPVKIHDARKNAALVEGQESGKFDKTVTRPPKALSDVADQSPTPSKQVVQKPLNAKLGSNSFIALHTIAYSGLEEGEICTNHAQINTIQRLIKETLYQEHGRPKVQSLSSKEPIGVRVEHHGRGFSPTL